MYSEQGDWFLRWNWIMLALWVVSAIAFAVVFNLWPEVARSTPFLVGSLVVFIGFAMVAIRRPKS